jgi:hypothetical protein
MMIRLRDRGAESDAEDCGQEFFGIHCWEELGFKRRFRDCSDL